jgi:drug/metabolite transporter (DMT)-like permease
MVEALLALAGTVVCYGTATVLQDVAAKRADRQEGNDALLAVRLLRDLPYLAGTALDGLGFLLSLLALRQLPVFAVQAGVAGSIGVTAILAAIVFGERLIAQGWAALVLLCCGLVAVAGSAAPEAADDPGQGTRAGIIASVVVLAALGWLALRHRHDRRSAIALAAVSGLAYGGVALAARLLSAGDGTYFSGDGLLHLLADPMLYALAGFGALGMGTFAAALQRGTVTTVAAVVVVAETIAPALAGIALLGDRARPGLGFVAVLAFVATVVGAWLLTTADPGRAPRPAESDGAGPSGPRPESRESA